MANPIYCDVHGQSHVADFLVSRLADGDSIGACGAAYVELCRLVVEQADAPEVAETTEDAVARLEAMGDPTDPPTSPESSDAGDPAPEPPTRRAGGSKSADVGSETSPDPDAALGPSEEPVGDAGEVADPA